MKNRETKTIIYLDIAKRNVLIIILKKLLTICEKSGMRCSSICLFIKDNLVTDTHEWTDQFNNYFISVASEIK